MATTKNLTSLVSAMTGARRALSPHLHVCCTRWRDRQPCAEDTGYDVSGDGIPQSEIDANAEIASAEAAAAEEVHLTWSNNVRSS